MSSKSQIKTKREGPLKIPLKFDDAIQRALKVNPPPEGWAEYEKKLKRGRRIEAAEDEFDFPCSSVDRLHRKRGLINRRCPAVCLLRVNRDRDVQERKAESVRTLHPARPPARARL